MELIFLDTETTGNDTAKDRLCQVCYKTSSGIRTEYFKPPMPVSVKAMSITHITNKMLEGKPAFQGSDMEKDLQGRLDSGVLIAHNAKFDVAMLENEGMKIPNRICTLRVARFLDSENAIPEYNLQYLRYYLGLEVEGNAHDAECDVKVLNAVFDRLFSKLRKTEESEESTLAKMIEISKTPSVYKQFDFGKHKGKKIEDVAKVDRGYLEWLLKEKLATDANDEDWIYTLKRHLNIL
jgi:exodeoxyribonuclease X